MSEVEIRTPFLNNAKFLLPYQRCEPDAGHEAILMDALGRMESATPSTLLLACAQNQWNQAQLMPTLWNLVGRRAIGTDLDEPLTMTTMLWHPRVHP